MTDYARLATTLSAALALRHPPIAVALTDDVPAGVPAPAGQAAAGCVFWQKAAAGPIATDSRDHELCAIGVYTHNLAETPASQGEETSRVLQAMAELGYVRAEDVPLIPVAKKRAARVVYATLADMPLAADVVLVFADARQGLVLTEAVQQVELAAMPALGRPACAVVPQVLNTGRAALSLGCCGARAYLGILGDDVALWALPGHEIERYVARIVELVRANEFLGEFHTRRAQDVAAGERPTFAESLARMEV